jgi:hypothetical protein
MVQLKVVIDYGTVQENTELPSSSVLITAQNISVWGAA